MFEAIDPVAEAWDQLVDRVRATPFVRPGWMQAWLAAFGDSGLRIYTVWRDQHLVALLPLRARRHALSSPTNFQTQSFAPLAEDAAAANALTRAVLADGPRRVGLGYLAAEVPASAECEYELQQYGYRRLTQHELRSPYTDVTVEWDVLLHRLGRQRRQVLRRKQRRLSDMGTLRLDLQDGTDHLDRLLDEGFTLEASGWKGRQGTAILANTDLLQFYEAVARWAAPAGWLRLFFLRLDGRAIAFKFTLRHDDIIYYLKGGYDEHYGKWSPGILLMSEMVQSACADDTRVIEWLGADEPFKLEWSDGARERVSSTWFAPTVLGSAEYHWLRFWWEARRRGKDMALQRLPEPMLTQLKTARAKLRRRSVRPDGASPSEARRTGETV